MLANEDGLIRGLASPIYPLLTAEDAGAAAGDCGRDPRNAPSGEMFRYGIRWAGLDLLARFRIREGMTLCVDMMNEFEWGRDQNQCTEPLKKYGGAAKEVVPRLQVTILALRKAIEAEPWNEKTWNKDILAIEQLIKEIEAGQNPAPVLSIEEFTGKKK